MKRVYFIRHGEDEGTAGALRQSPVDALTDIGMQQAGVVAKRLAGVPFDIILSSTQTRAKQTAEIINSSLKKPLEYSDLLIERNNPSVILGKRKDDPEVRRIVDLFWGNFHNNWHHSDEENFQDLKERASKAIQYIDSRTEENILIVTHGELLRMILALVLIGRELTSHQLLKVFGATELHNTGIAIFEEAKWRSESTYWRLVTWNDCGHLQSTR